MSTFVLCLITFLLGVWCGETFDLYYKAREVYGRARNWVKSRK